jgi:hypothetical protein
MSLLSQFFPSGGTDNVGNVAAGLAADYSKQIPVDIIVVGGGGGAGGVPSAGLSSCTSYSAAISAGSVSGGGGAGRVIAYEGAVVNIGTPYPITVAGGGAVNANGSTSCFGIIVAKGGGNGQGVTPDGTAVPAGYHPSSMESLGGAGGGGSSWPSTSCRGCGISGVNSFCNTFLSVFRSLVQSETCDQDSAAGSGYAHIVRTDSTVVVEGGGAGGCLCFAGNGGSYSLQNYNCIISKYDISSLTNIGCGGGGSALSAPTNGITIDMTFQTITPTTPFLRVSPNTTPQGCPAGFCNTQMCSYIASPTNPTNTSPHPNSWGTIDFTYCGAGSRILVRTVGAIPSVYTVGPFPSITVGQPPGTPPGSFVGQPLVNTNKVMFYNVLPDMNGCPGSGAGGHGGLRHSPSPQVTGSATICGTVSIPRTPNPPGGSVPTTVAPWVAPSPYSASFPGISCQGGSGGSGSVWVIYPSDYAAATVTGNTVVPSPPAYRVYRWDGAGTITFNAP